jgi:hypothetical protein
MVAKLLVMRLGGLHHLGESFHSVSPDLRTRTSEQHTSIPVFELRWIGGQVASSKSKDWIGQKALHCETKNSIMTSTKKKSNTTSALIAGCIAGGIEATAVWPMEYMKTQLQLQVRVF